MNKKEKEQEKHCIWLYILAGIAAVASLSTIAYLLYRHFKPDYLEDFDDDYDDFDDDDIYEEDEIVDDTINTNSNTQPTEE
nr:hypothetical protein [Anaeromicropila herbilytica]